MAADRLVRRLSVVVFLEWLGAGAVLPLLPLYLKEQGASAGLVGLTMASFFLAALLLQFPAGHIADRVGRRPVLVVGLLAYGAASLAFLLPASSWGFVVFRFVQGGAAGAVEVASLALVSSAIPIVRRGRAVSKIYSAQLSGTVVGPLFGSFVGVHHMGWLFTGTAVLCTVAAIPVLNSSTIEAHDRRDATEGPLPKVTIDRQVLGAVLGGVTLGLAVGVYEACWSLLMNSRHATELQVGLSWTIFSLPYVFLVRVGGWLADHLDRRVLAIGGLSVGCCFLATWPFVPSVTVMLVLCFCEALGSSLALPSVQALLTQGRRPQELGRLQGIYATGQTGATAISASIAGFLFTIGHPVPFVLAASIGAVLLVIVMVLWSKVPGRVRDLPHNLQVATDQP